MATLEEQVHCLTPGEFAEQRQAVRVVEDVACSRVAATPSGAASRGQSGPRPRDR